MAVRFVQVPALVTSWPVQSQSRANSCRCQCIGEVHLSSRKRWWVKAVGSPAHNFAVSTDCGCGEDWAIMKRAGVCILQTGSGTVGASTSGVRGEGGMWSTSSMMRSYAVGSTFGGIGEPPSWWMGIAVELLKQKKVKGECLED